MAKIVASGKRTQGQQALQVFREHGYDAYLQTPHWRALRERLIGKNGRCRGCRRRLPRYRLQLHHLSYVHLGAEKPEDFVRMCRDCHEKLHVHLDQAFPRFSADLKAEKTAKVWPNLFGQPLWQTRPAKEPKSRGRGGVYVPKLPCWVCGKTKIRQGLAMCGACAKQKDRKEWDESLPPKKDRPKPKSRISPCPRCKIRLTPTGENLCLPCQKMVAKRPKQRRRRRKRAKYSPSLGKQCARAGS